MRYSSLTPSVLMSLTEPKILDHQQRMARTQSIFNILVYFYIFQFSNITGEFIEPTLDVVMTVHPFNKKLYLPFSLGAIESQDYPKDRINIVFLVGVFGSESLDTQAFRNNQETLDMLRSWRKANIDQFYGISIREDIQSPEDEIGEEYWTRRRYSQIMQIKEDALRAASKNWADFVLFMDADVILTNPKVFRYLLFDQRNDSQIIFSPMLDSIGAYSNFWAGMTDRGYYLRTENYLPILERKRIGSFRVPMVHSCIFIDLSDKKSHQLSFSPIEDNPFDDIISFAMRSKSLSLDMYINNEQTWGFIPPAWEPSQIQEKVLQDLELESLVDGQGFPVARSLKKFVSRPKKDSLGVDHVYIINLVRRTERHDRMKKVMDVLGIQAQFWPGTDGKDLTKEGIDRLGIRLLPNYLDPYHKRPMTTGEIGCFLSHYFVWKDMIDRNFSMIVVLEDDVRFEVGFRERFGQGLQELVTRGQNRLTHPFDFVYLGRKKQSTREEERVSSFFVKPKYSYWTIGYMLTKTGASKLIDSNPLRKLLPVDEYLPIMYDEHPTQEWLLHFSPRNLQVLSFDPVIINPTHYVGDTEYISDTEDSDLVTHDVNHPKLTPSSCFHSDAATCHSEL